MSRDIPVVVVLNGNAQEELRQIEAAEAEGRPVVLVELLDAQFVTDQRLRAAVVRCKGTRVSLTNREKSTLPW